MRALAEGVPDGEPYLFAPRETRASCPASTGATTSPARRTTSSSAPAATPSSTTADGETVRTYLDVGENPPAGVIVTYRLVAAPEEPLRLTFRDAGGEEVRAFSSRKADDPPQAKERRAPAQAGWNRFVWDMRHAPATKIEGTDPAGRAPIPVRSSPPATTA